MGVERLTPQHTQDTFAFLNRFKMSEVCTRYRERGLKAVDCCNYGSNRLRGVWCSGTSTSAVVRMIILIHECGQLPAAAADCFALSKLLFDMPSPPFCTFQGPWSCESGAFVPPPVRYVEFCKKVDTTAPPSLYGFIWLTDWCEEATPVYVMLSSYATRYVCAINNGKLGRNVEMGM